MSEWSRGKNSHLRDVEKKVWLVYMILLRSCTHRNFHFLLRLEDGGMVAPSGIAIEKFGDVGDDMVVVCASVTVGH